MLGSPTSFCADAQYPFAQRLFLFDPPRHHEAMFGTSLTLSAKLRMLLALVIFSAVTSAVMSAIVCGVMTYKMAGFDAAFMHLWVGGWTTAWPVAFAVILVAGPVIRKIVYRACRCPSMPISATVDVTESQNRA